MFKSLLCSLAALAAIPTTFAESHLMRFADVHRDHIVFTYEDDLWLASTNDATAHRITNHPGTEAWAKFSPDGKWLAFSAQYDGGLDVYVMPLAGGPPRQLTFHPSTDRVLDWWPDGKSILFRARRQYPSRGEEIYRVSLAGGLPQQLPVDRAGLATVSPDGNRIAYNRITREHSTWKRHRGGTAQDIWMGSLHEMDYRKIIDSDWSDNFPMWRGDSIYFNSDREDGTLNLYRYDTESGNTTRLTQYTDYDVKYPSCGPDHIIYQYAETLHLLDLNTLKTRPLNIDIPSDRVHVRTELVDIHPSTGAFNLSPTGVRLLVEARGEIVNLPVEDGEPVNLTQASASHEKNAAWSPDGRWIAFLSDKTGEEEVWLIDQLGEQPWRQLTKGGLGYRTQLVWSPDSKYLAFSDKFMRLNIVNAETGKITVADQGEYDDAWERWGIQDYCWSPDSRWVAYTKMEGTMYESIFLYSLDAQQVTRLTSNMTQDWSPSFDPDGKHLYFLSNRTFNPIMGFVDQNHIFIDLAKPYIVLLAADAESPFAPQEDLEEVETADDDADDDEAADADDEDDAEEDDGTQIDLDGLSRRVLVAENVSAGNYFRLEAIKGGFVYLSKPEPEFIKYQNVNDETTGALDLYKYDLDDREASKLMSGIANYHLSADHKKLVYRAGGTYGVVDAGSSASVGDGKVDYGHVKLEIDRLAEFHQIFNEAWRIERDWFYDPGLHGLDWEAIGDKYRKFVPFCGNRSDLNYLIGEMIAELNIGHTYVWGGDQVDGAERISVGLLGVEFEAPEGSRYYRFGRIIPGTPGVPGERSPLDEPGCPIEEGDYLTAINGQEVTTADNPYELLRNYAGRVIRLEYNDKPSRTDAQTYRTETLRNEWGLRYRDWVNSRMEYVDRKSNGRVGYVHIPDMGANGLAEFARYYYPQYQKEAFVVDVRYNGGGFTGDMIIDRLEREVWSFSHPREGKRWRNPERGFAGPWVVLINEDTGSNGEMFAEAIKIKDMAPIIGMRTWGGSIGIEVHQHLLDNGTVTPPQFGLYGLNGQWLIEGTGVVPDIEVQNMPGELLRGVDAQLDAAIENVLKRLPSEGFDPAPPPEYPEKQRPYGS